jgi:hypothetical protein
MNHCNIMCYSYTILRYWYMKVQTGCIRKMTCNNTDVNIMTSSAGRHLGTKILPDCGIQDFRALFLLHRGMLQTYSVQQEIPEL